MRFVLWGRVAAVGAAVSLPGCFLARLLPDMRTAAEHARDVVTRCAAFGEEGTASLLAPSSVESVEPAYLYVSSGSADREARLRGARLHLAPTAGMTSEVIQRKLECHEARVVLGEAPARQVDPYAIGGAWLEIRAESEGDGFVVAVRTDELPEAKDVLKRARLFAASAPVR